ncbi:MAG: hypothetical protein EXQ85_00790 [Alphaproteobacteria bacterium]|nr:hypothetical protein [Alphaproteobacteria bacterium]
MEWQSFWKLIHVVMFVYWVGADLGVFYSARLIINNPQYSVATRQVLLQNLGIIDMIPRYTLLLTFPVGAQLAAGLGASTLTGGWLWLIWIASIAWIVFITVIHNKEGQPIAKTMANVDLALRYAFIAFLLITAVMTIMGGGFYAQEWIGWKVLGFAAAVICGVGIRLSFKPFVVGFGRLIKEGSNPEVEALLRKGLNAAMPWVFGIWVFAAITAFIGMNHERLFGS